MDGVECWYNTDDPDDTTSCQSQFNGASPPQDWLRVACAGCGTKLGWACPSCAAKETLLEEVCPNCPPERLAYYLPPPPRPPLPPGVLERLAELQRAAQELPPNLGNGIIDLGPGFDPPSSEGEQGD